MFVVVFPLTVSYSLTVALCTWILSIWCDEWKQHSQRSMNKWRCVDGVMLQVEMTRKNSCKVTRPLSHPAKYSYFFSNLYFISRSQFKSQSEASCRHLFRLSLFASRLFSARLLLPRRLLLLLLLDFSVSPSPLVRMLLSHLLFTNLTV